MLPQGHVSRPGQQFRLPGNSTGTAVNLKAPLPRGRQLRARRVITSPCSGAKPVEDEFSSVIVGHSSSLHVNRRGNLEAPAWQGRGPVMPSRRLHCNLLGPRSIAKALLEVRVPPGPPSCPDRLTENPGRTLHAEHFLTSETAVEE